MFTADTRNPIVSSRTKVRQENKHLERRGRAALIEAHSRSVLPTSVCGHHLANYKSSIYIPLNEATDCTEKIFVRSFYSRCREHKPTAAFRCVRTEAELLIRHCAECTNRRKRRRRYLWWKSVGMQRCMRGQNGDAACAPVSRVFCNLLRNGRFYCIFLAPGDLRNGVEIRPPHVSRSWPKVIQKR
jgi:hypothetical protein